jgi:hypothetical protein
MLKTGQLILRTSAHGSEKVKKTTDIRSNEQVVLWADHSVIARAWLYVRVYRYLTFREKGTVKSDTPHGAT